MMPSDVEYDGSEIAICGMAGRFPGAADVSEFWRNLREGVESISTFTKDEVLAGGEEPELVDNAHYVRARAIVDGVDRFDAAFFGITPREAQVLDPQERLLLECVWEALEDAGCDTQRPSGRVGLFAGAPMSTYLAHNLYRNRPVMQAVGDVETTVYNSPGSVATFAAYKLNLKGACCSVQTFCSTSLVAVHLACQSLLNYENDIAIAGGVTVFSPQRRGYLFQEGGIVSPDGKCRVFAAEAAGTVFGNGAGAVVLKRLKDAIAERDTIHAVIRGSAINNDGALKVSYAAPSVVGQTEVIVEAMSAAGVDPATIEYVEAHGTGTKLGDPAEVEALTKAFRTKTQKKAFCAIGSVKGNVGHLDAAAGVTGLIKTVLCLKHGQIPPSLHCETMNPLIDFANSPFYVNRALTAWNGDRRPRRAAVSAFGIGGTNAHVVLEEAPEPAPDDRGRPAHLLILSAKTGDALEEASRKLSAWLSTNPQLHPGDVAYTLQVGRRQFNHRRAVVADSAATAAALLASADPTRVLSAEQNRRNPPVVFVFPDEDAAHVHVARGLYEHDRTFRKEVDAACEAAKRIAGCDVRSALYPSAEGNGALDGITRRLALFVVEHALARLWMSWGVRPEAVAGCGAGEWAAACIAGVCSMDDALTLLAHASGQSGVAVQSGRVRLRSPNVPVVSAAAGALLSAEDAASVVRLSASPARPERLADAVRSLPSDGRRVLLEIGPESEGPTTERLASLPRLRTGGNDIEHALGTLGRLWLAGVEIDWSGFYGDERRRRVPLPTYPFERRRFWVDPILDELESPKATSGKNPDIAQWIHVPTWKSSPPVPNIVAEDHRPCLVFLDSRGIGAELVEALRQCGREVVTVTTGEISGGSLGSGYVVNARSETAYAALFAQLAGLGKLPGTIVHTWLVDPVDRSDEFNAAFDRGFFSLVHLTEALSHHPEAEGVQLRIISTEVHDVTGMENLSPAKAPALALGRVIQQEHQNIRCSAIDIEMPAASSGLRSKLRDALLAETMTTAPDPVVAYRWNKRWVQDFDRLLSPADIAGRLRQEGVYLITGGLGSVGLVMAACLARWVHAKLVLVGRSAVPPPAEWDDWVADHAPDDATSRRIRNLKAIQAMGGEVLTIAADVADLAQMRTAFALAHERFGRVDGVIHGAGVLSGDTFQPVRQLTREACERQFAPKIRGLQVLDEVLADTPVDFCLLTSSLSSVLGGLGYGAYAAANAFMDAFAAAKGRMDGTPWISIDWDQWRFEDRTGQSPAAGSTLEALAMVPGEGAAVLERVLRHSQPRQFVISTTSLDARIATWIRMAAAPVPKRPSRPSDLDRIETVMAAHPAIREAVVVAEGTGEERRFVAYVLFRDGVSLTSSELRRFAREHLSADQVPSFFSTLDETHVGPDGRIDRTAIESASDQAEGQPADASAPRTATERRIAAIWREVLGVEAVRVHDNFFDIGGHSLLSVRVIAKIEAALRLRLDYRTMFLETLEQIAARCDRHANGDPSGDVVVAEVSNR